jgi:hypothetical protein
VKGDVIIYIYVYFIQVAQSNTECLSMGNNMCKLNYEDTNTFEIKVLVSDNGVPAQSQTFFLSIEITDENDPPRNLQLSGLYNNTIQLCEM